MRLNVIEACGTHFTSKIATGGLMTPRSTMTQHSYSMPPDDAAVGDHSTKLPCISPHVHYSNGPSLASNRGRGYQGGSRC